VTSLDLVSNTCLSWSFVLTRCCTLTWVTKILIRAISNVYAGCRFPTPVLNNWQCLFCLPTQNIY